MASSQHDAFTERMKKAVRDAAKAMTMLKNEKHQLQQMLDESRTQAEELINSKENLERQLKRSVEDCKKLRETVEQQTQTIEDLRREQVEKKVDTADRAREQALADCAELRKRLADRDLKIKDLEAKNKLLNQAETDHRENDKSKSAPATFQATKSKPLFLKKFDTLVGSSDDSEIDDNRLSDTASLKALANNQTSASCDTKANQSLPKQDGFVGNSISSELDGGLSTKEKRTKENSKEEKAPDTSGTQFKPLFLKNVGTLVGNSDDSEPDEKQPLQKTSPNESKGTSDQAERIVDDQSKTKVSSTQGSPKLGSELLPSLSLSSDEEGPINQQPSASQSKTKVESFQGSPKLGSEILPSHSLSSDEEERPTSQPPSASQATKASTKATSDSKPSASLSSDEEATSAPGPSIWQDLTQNMNKGVTKTKLDAESSSSESSGDEDDKAKERLPTEQKGVLQDTPIDEVEEDMVSDAVVKKKEEESALTTLPPCSNQPPQASDSALNTDASKVKNVSGSKEMATSKDSASKGMKRPLPSSPSRSDVKDTRKVARENGQDISWSQKKGGISQGNVFDLLLKYPKLKNNTGKKLMNAVLEEVALAEAGRRKYLHIELADILSDPSRRVHRGTLISHILKIVTSEGRYLKLNTRDGHQMSFVEKLVMELCDGSRFTLVFLDQFLRGCTKRLHAIERKAFRQAKDKWLMQSVPEKPKPVLPKEQSHQAQPLPVTTKEKDTLSTQPGKDTKNNSLDKSLDDALEGLSDTDSEPKFSQKKMESKQEDGIEGISSSDSEPEPTRKNAPLLPAKRKATVDKASASTFTLKNKNQEKDGIEGISSSDSEPEPTRKNDPLLPSKKKATEDKASASTFPLQNMNQEKELEKQQPDQSDSDTSDEELQNLFEEDDKMSGVCQPPATIEVENKLEHSESGSDASDEELQKLFEEDDKISSACHPSATTVKKEGKTEHNQIRSDSSDEELQKLFEDDGKISNAFDPPTTPTVLKKEEDNQSQLEDKPAGKDVGEKNLKLESLLLGGASESDGHQSDGGCSFGMLSPTGSFDKAFEDFGVHFHEQAAAPSTMLQKPVEDFYIPRVPLQSSKKIVAISAVFLKLCRAYGESGRARVAVVDSFRYTLPRVNAFFLLALCREWPQLLQIPPHSRHQPSDLKGRLEKKINPLLLTFEVLTCAFAKHDFRDARPREWQEIIFELGWNHSESYCGTSAIELVSVLYELVKISPDSERAFFGEELVLDVCLCFELLCGALEINFAIEWLQRFSKHLEDLHQGLDSSKEMFSFYLRICLHIFGSCLRLSSSYQGLTLIRQILLLMMKTVGSCSQQSKRISKDALVEAVQALRYLPIPFHKECMWAWKHLARIPLKEKWNLPLEVVLWAQEVRRRSALHVVYEKEEGEEDQFIPKVWQQVVKECQRMQTCKFLLDIHFTDASASFALHTTLWETFLQEGIEGDCMVIASCTAETKFPDEFLKKLEPITSEARAPFDLCQLGCLVPGGPRPIKGQFMRKMDLSTQECTSYAVSLRATRKLIRGKASFHCETSSTRAFQTVSRYIKKTLLQDPSMQAYALTVPLVM